MSRLEREKVKHGFNRHMLLSCLIILIVIPAVIAFGIIFLGDRKYYLISLLIILLTMLPFFMSFESRKPSARELAVIAAMCAIGVAGRGAFFMLPQFKPMVSIVIITGICFGAESGFLTGAMTAFVSNFFFGQGPWTPWQMFCCGIIGFLAGLIFGRKPITKIEYPLVIIFGGLSTLIIYGGLMNLSTLFSSVVAINWQTVLSIYASGLPFDLVHAAATVFFLIIALKPLTEKLYRIKIKYGLMSLKQ